VGKCHTAAHPNDVPKSKFLKAKQSDNKQLRFWIYDDICNEPQDVNNEITLHNNILGLYIWFETI